MQHAIDSRMQAVALFLTKAAEPNIEDEVRDYMCRFGAVLICGTVERCVEVVILDRLANRAQTRVLAFLKSYFKRGTNYDCPAIGQLLNRFDSEWYRRFSEFVDCNPDVKEGLASCYVIRNSVAHGGAQTVGLDRLKQLHESGKRAVQALIEATR